MTRAQRLTRSAILSFTLMVLMVLLTTPAVGAFFAGDPTPMNVAFALIVLFGGTGLFFLAKAEDIARAENEATPA